jgi:hypothetical protein
MPRNGSGVYSLPPGSSFTPNTLIQSAVINGINNDLATDLNVPRPIVAGGTGASTAAAAVALLGAINKAGDTVTGALGFTLATNKWHQKASNSVTLAASGGNLIIDAGAGLVLIGEDLSAGGSALFLFSQTSSVKIADPGGYYSTTIGNSGTINVGYLAGTGMIINNGRAAAVTVKTLMLQTRTVV